MVNCTEYIWKEYHARLHSFILSRLGKASVADDILQEVFMRIHSQIDTLKDCGKIRGWIYQITRNAIIDYYRAQKKPEELPPRLAGPEPKLSDKAKEDISTCLMPMIENLPDHYRQALMLSEIQGRTQKEAAEEQGISLSGAKSRVQRGRAMIKDMMLGCCHFEFDRRGNIIDYERRGDCSCCTC
jgi:RNA polymerase sigma-70 factor (ECF subfamily)